MTHLDSCQCIIQLLGNRSHLVHSTWETDLFAMIYDLANSSAGINPLPLWVIT